MKCTAARFAVIMAACFFGGCSGEEGDGQPPVIDTSHVRPVTTTQSASNGIPSSGTGAGKKKPDPVGAMSPIIPKR